MVKGNGTPETHWDGLDASTDFGVLFRYGLNGRVLIYNLRILPDNTAQVLVNVEMSGEVHIGRREHFRDPDECLSFLQDEERRLKAEGWTELPHS